MLHRLSFVWPRNVSQEGIGVLPRPVVMSENPANHVFVDWDVERQGDLWGHSRTAPIGIPLLHFDDRMNEMYARSFRTGLPTDSWRRASGTFACSRLCEALAVSRASVQLRNGEGGLDAPKAPASRQGCVPRG